MKKQPLPRITPEEAGISSEQVQKCIKELMHDKTYMNGFMAARHGKVFAECWWAPYGPDIVHSNHSFGKSYTATAIAIAKQEGKLNFQEKMVDVFAQEIAERNIEVPDLMKEITIENVMTMTNGMEHHPEMSEDWIGDYFRTPMKYKPGERFMYNSSGSCMLGAIILKRCGQNLKEYLTERLFEKIGIDTDRFVWLKFHNGIDGEPGTFATTEDNLRLVLLYMNGGKWNGEQILDEDFVKAALSVHVDTSYAPEQKDGRCGYGYQLWACSIPGVYRFDGGQGQYGIIWPEKELAISLHEGGICPYGPQKTLDVLYENLLLKLADEPLPENNQAYKNLVEYEKSMAMPNDKPNEIENVFDFSGKYKIIEGKTSPWFAVAPGKINLFEMFQDTDKNPNMDEFVIKTDHEKITLIVDDYAVFEVYFDGKMRLHYTDSVYPELGYNCSTARYLDENTLKITIHWMNGWFVTEMTLSKDGDLFAINTKKTRLRDGDNWMEEQAKATR
ncbi:MAG: serine hydrolase [Eubacteriales bacterium]